MLIKMLTTSAGPNVDFNFTEGDKRNVSEEEARYWHDAGCCELLEPYPSEAEKAVIQAQNKAVTCPKETAQGETRVKVQTAFAGAPWPDTKGQA